MLPAGTVTEAVTEYSLDSIFLVSVPAVVAMLADAVTVEEATSGIPAVNENERPISIVTDTLQVDSFSIVVVNVV